MMKPERLRPGLVDVARRAGVGIATVDRVVNERGGVSAETERRVLEAARAVGLRRLLPAPHARARRIEVLLGPPVTPFMRRLNSAIAQVAATLDRSVTVLRSGLDMAEPARVAARIAHSRADGIIIYCEEHAANVAAIAEAEAAGRAVICVVTDVPEAPRTAYVGIDHAKAGRTAGFFVARMARARGQALILATSQGFRAHKQRIDGFRAALAAHAPAIAASAVMTTHDAAERCYHHVTHALRRAPGEVVAIYNTGGGNEGVGQALRDHAAAAALAAPVFVGHELTEETAVLLTEGLMTVTIDQAPELQARRAIDLILKRLAGGGLESAAGEIAFTLHTAENC
ncbi:LacI family DNA-binding transcriptional regulator [Acidisoma sp. C75]